MVKTFTRLAVALITGTLSYSSAAYETFVELGINTHSGKYNTQVASIDDHRESGNGVHLAVGIMRNFGQSKKHWLGTGLDFDRMLGSRMTGFRAINYNYQLGKRARVGAYIGAASLDSGLPQNGYYRGANLTWQNLFANTDIALDARYASGLARDRLLESDPHPVTRQPDIFVDIFSTSLSLKWRF